MGKLTFPHSVGGSVVDYFVATHALFAMHLTLTVGDSQPESDHRLVCLSLHLHQPPPPAPPQHKHSRPKLRHRPEPLPRYCELLAAQLSLDSTSDHIAAWLQSCIATAASAAHGLQSPACCVRTKSRPWIDTECWQARQALRLSSRQSHVHHFHALLLAAYKADVQETQILAETHK